MFKFILSTTLSLALSSSLYANPISGNGPVNASEAMLASSRAPINKNDIKIFTGNANPQLAQSIATQMGVSLGKSRVKRFNDGEISIKILENVRNQDVFVVQPTCSAENGSVNDNIMELLLMIRTLKRASAASVTAVIPYYGYARQDRKTEPRVPISASDVAMLIESAGADRVVAVDLHCGQIQGFFHKAPVDNLFATRLFVPYFAGLDLVKPVVVSPDAGGVERAKKFRDSLKRQGLSAELAIVVKQRAGAGKVASMDLVGDVEGSDVIIMDDLVDTAGTLCKAAEALKAEGARRVYACITHPVLSGPAMERIENSVLTEIVVTDTIPVGPGPQSKIKQLSVAPLLSETIEHIYDGQSVSELFL